MFDGVIQSIGNTISDFMRTLLWVCSDALIKIIKQLLDSMINGVMQNSLISSTYINEAFNFFLALMFLILPVKIIYELVASVIKDDDNGLSLSKKFGNTLFGVMIAVSLTVTVPLANTLTINLSKALTSDETTKNQFNEESDSSLGNSLVESVIVGFGGMAAAGDNGASSMMDAYNDGTLNVTERLESNSYRWQFSELMLVIGLIIYVVLVFVLVLQVAMRMFMIAFLYAIGPVCCLSCTNYQNPQAFTVWKNTLIGQFVMNLSQIFLLNMLANMISVIGSWNSMSTIVLCVCYFGAFSVVLMAPAFVQGMIGGYGAGIMETMNQLRGAFSLGKATTVGLVAGTIGAVAGRRSDYTGFRQGGVRGAIAGNKRADGTRSGGIIGNTLGQRDKFGNRQGGLRGALAGDISTSVTQGHDGSSTVMETRSGGLRGAFAGSTATSYAQNKDGEKVMTRRMQTGGLRGTLAGNTEETFSQGKHGPISVPKNQIRSGGLYGAAQTGKRMMNMNPHRSSSGSSGGSGSSSGGDFSASVSAGKFGTARRMNANHSQPVHSQQRQYYGFDFSTNRYDPYKDERFRYGNERRSRKGSER